MTRLSLLKKLINEYRHTLLHAPEQADKQALLNSIQQLADDLLPVESSLVSLTPDGVADLADLTGELLDRRYPWPEITATLLQLNRNVITCLASTSEPDYEHRLACRQLVASISSFPPVEGLQLLRLAQTEFSSIIEVSKFLHYAKNIAISISPEEENLDGLAELIKELTMTSYQTAEQGDYHSFFLELQLMLNRGSEPIIRDTVVQAVISGIHGAPHDTDNLYTPRWGNSLVLTLSRSELPVEVKTPIVLKTLTALVDKDPNFFVKKLPELFGTITKLIQANIEESVPVDEDSGLASFFDRLYALFLEAEEKTNITPIDLHLLKILLTYPELDVAEIFSFPLRGRLETVYNQLFPKPPITNLRDSHPYEEGKIEISKNIATRKKILDFYTLERIFLDADEEALAELQEDLDLSYLSQENFDNVLKILTGFEPQVGAEHCFSLLHPSQQTLLAQAFLNYGSEFQRGYFFATVPKSAEHYTLGQPQAAHNEPKILSNNKEYFLCSAAEPYLLEAIKDKQLFVIRLAGDEEECGLIMKMKGKRACIAISTMQLGDRVLEEGSFVALPEDMMDMIRKKYIQGEREWRLTQNETDRFTVIYLRPYKKENEDHKRPFEEVRDLILAALPKLKTAQAEMGNYEPFT